MNCPLCSNELISARMRKDENGHPTFTLICSEHGFVGEKKFKDGFRNMAGYRMTMLRGWTELFSAIILAATACRSSGVTHLRNKMNDGSLSTYLISVYRMMREIQTPENAARGHEQIGRCGRCDGIYLSRLGYRCLELTLGDSDEGRGFSFLTEAHAQDLYWTLVEPRMSDDGGIRLLPDDEAANF